MLNNLVIPLDQLRVAFLRLAMSSFSLRRLYSSSSSRLLASFLLLCLVYVPLSLRRPDLLLWLGPMLFGYPHLLASYRFLHAGERLANLRPFLFFSTLTLLSLGAHHLASHLGWIPELPFGAWELATAALMATLVAAARGQFLSAPFCAATGLILWKLSWMQPLVFVASALLLHNWVGFLAWIFRARGKNRLAAITATAIFGLIHFAVFSGYADFLMPKGDEGGVLSRVQWTGAALAPWSGDLVAWYRTVMLYTFGLSLHYFVWLKAIPECRGRVPLSWRRSLDLFRQELGDTLLILALAAWAAGFGIWCAFPELGARLYFQLATLHGWLELMFLGFVGAASIVFA